MVEPLPMTNLVVMFLSPELGLDLAEKIPQASFGHGSLHTCGPPIVPSPLIGIGLVLQSVDGVGVALGFGHPA